MNGRGDNLFAALNKVFHEPNRLAIVSALCGAADAMSFTELKDECNLTDGNLNRHLKALEEAGSIELRKSHAGARPRTTVRLSEAGRESFMEYLHALEGVLQLAAEATGEERPVAPPVYSKPVLSEQARSDFFYR